MTEKQHGSAPETAPSRFDTGFDDAFIVPLVFVALAANKLFRALLSALVRILDYAFPILLQVLRFPLFTLRMVGDGIVALLRGIVDVLPMSEPGRAAWRAAVARHWAWLRRTLSYKAFEDALHHAFEGGMAWVFRRCRSLTPSGALLVIAGAVLWLPISFGIATAIHAILIAEATSLPAWMQLLHPLATLIAKSKLLVLPVYPAAWPQAKQHPFVQATFRVYQRVTTLQVMEKVEYRYRQTEYVAATTAGALRRFAVRIGLDNVLRAMMARLGGLAGWLRTGSRAALAFIIDALSRVPLIGSIVRSYAAHYHRADQPDNKSAGERMSAFFTRWALNFSAEYYEAKDRQQAAARGTGAGS